MLISDMAELRVYLAQVQLRREREVRCHFSPALSAKASDAELTEALICGLPMVQGIQHRLLRSRGQGCRLTAKLRYRDGVRMLAGISLSNAEAAALDHAKAIVSGFLPLAEEARFHAVYTWICRNIQYVHTAPGQKGYERLVGAAGVLTDNAANCQGFADVLYLLCGLCGIACEYRVGRGEKHLHVWNAVRLNGIWQETDASKGARALSTQER